MRGVPKRMEERIRGLQHVHRLRHGEVYEWKWFRILSQVPSRSVQTPAAAAAAAAKPNKRWCVSRVPSRTHKRIGRRYHVRRMCAGALQRRRRQVHVLALWHGFLSRRKVPAGVQILPHWLLSRRKVSEKMQTLPRRNDCRRYWFNKMHCTALRSPRLVQEKPRVP